MGETATEVQSALTGCEVCLTDRYPRFDKEEVALVCKEVRQLQKALMLACGRIADGPQEYSEAKTAKGWADHYRDAGKG